VGSGYIKGGHHEENTKLYRSARHRTPGTKKGEDAVEKKWLRGEKEGTSCNTNPLIAKSIDGKGNRNDPARKKTGRKGWWGEEKLRRVGGRLRGRQKERLFPPNKPVTKVLETQIGKKGIRKDQRGRAEGEK